MINYHKSVDLAKSMNLNKSTLESFDSLVQTIVPSFLQKSVFESAMDFGLKAAHTVIDTEKIKLNVERDIGVQAARGRVA